VFKTEFTGVNYSYITDFDALRQLGDQKVLQLVETLNSTGRLESAGTPSASLGLGGKAFKMTMISVFFIILPLFVFGIVA
jgi:hypothetical protein